MMKNNVKIIGAIGLALMLNACAGAPWHERVVVCCCQMCSCLLPGWRMFGAGRT